MNDEYMKVKERFPNAKFSIDCFRNVDEITNKILSDDNEIIYADSYVIGNETLMDFFIIKKKENQEHIYYHDVIDLLIEKQFTRDDCDHRYMENIGEIYKNKRNPNSTKIFGSFWGS